MSTRRRNTRRPFRRYRPPSGGPRFCSQPTHAATNSANCRCNSWQRSHCDGANQGLTELDDPLVPFAPDPLAPLVPLVAPPAKPPDNPAKEPVPPLPFPPFPPIDWNEPPPE